MKEKQTDTINIAFTKEESKKIKTYCAKNDMSIREFVRRSAEHYFAFIKNNK
jgi:hypothetical protein